VPPATAGLLAEVSATAPDELARLAAQIATRAQAEVFEAHKHADRVLAAALRGRRNLSLADQRFVSQAVFALFRWRGWIEPALRDRPIEHHLLVSTLMDLEHVVPACRVWARQSGVDPSALMALGDAPGWPAKVAGLRRMLGGRNVNPDPWKLVPDWVRTQVPVPPGEGSDKVRYAEWLRVVQSRSPLWVRYQGADPAAAWEALRSGGIKPWVHRRLDRAARLDGGVDIYHLPAFAAGELEIQDLASQAVGHVCDPEPGERWWDACAGAGGKALHLAALMAGKGVVVATDRQQWRLTEATRRARRSPFRNLTTKLWDGRHVAGKAGRYDGVLVDAPCSGLGNWRRNPEARWTFDPAAIPRLAAQQAELLAAAAAGVRPGGTLVYAVCTVTRPETQAVVQGFLNTHPAFRLDPFPHPFTGAVVPGMLTIWPQDADCDALFIARMTRTAPAASPAPAPVSS
jgi:16S rRNA (cytosine967-C5)-methyltransferase